MQFSRENFKYVLQCCRNNERRIKADALASDLLNKDIAQFWKHVDMQSSNKLSLANTVGEPLGIIILLLCGVLILNIYLQILNLKLTKNMLSMVSLIIQNGFTKSGGLDNLSAEHLLYAGQRLYIILSPLFNLCIVHVFY